MLAGAGRTDDTMRFTAHTPPPPLDRYVEYFWSLADAPPHARERIVPSGTLELVINLREDEFRIYDPDSPARPRRHGGAAVSGAYGRSFVIDAAQHASVVGVHFGRAARRRSSGCRPASWATPTPTSRPSGAARRPRSCASGCAPPRRRANGSAFSKPP
jgi:hypothetical protein